MKNYRKEEDQKRIGMLYPAAFSDEDTTLTNLSYCSTGRFIHRGIETIAHKDIAELVEKVQSLHSNEPYTALTVDTWGVNRGVMDALKASGIPVLSMEDMFLAISAKINCDTINSTPNIYTPEPEVFTSQDGHRYKLVDGKPERVPTMSVSMSLKGKNVDVEVL